MSIEDHRDRSGGTTTESAAERETRIAAKLADRYGTQTRARRQLTMLLAGVVVVAFAGWLGWATLAQSSPEAASGNLRFEIVDDQTALARFTVELADGVDATCTLKAYAEDHNLVGQISFSPVRSGQIEQRIATERRATSVELVGCTTPDQSRPR